MGAQYSIASLGLIAGQALAQDQDAVVWGNTSSGVFLHLASGWLVFLSFDRFRGPLTLNSSTQEASLSPSLFQQLKAGSPVPIRSKTLHFDSLGVEIAAQGAQIWSAPPRVAVEPAALAGRFDRIAYIHRKVSPVLADSHIPGLLPASVPAASLDVVSVARLLEENLGLGPGLTPAGDDLVLGFLLALNRWGDLLYPALDVLELSQSLSQAARRRTNTLSANLIACAALAQADERLILALDGILTGSPDPDACLAHLLSWGHTSGACAFEGLRLANALRISPPQGTISQIDRAA